VIVLVVLLAAIYLAHLTRFGRTVYAIGGNEQSALLMGLPVARTKMLVYTLNGFCSALAGVVFSIYMLSGYGLYTNGLELEAIASVVIGGTMLTGGVGYVIGTVFGVLIQGLIQTIIMFQGTLNSWWTKIVIGLLTLLFIGMQSLFVAAFVAEQGIDFPTLLAPDEITLLFYGVRGLPRTFVIAPDGTLAHTAIGALRPAEFSAWLDAQGL
jgi:ribose/xylose/arabinose/galactoside ABC-type transport system permease subunit